MIALPAPLAHHVALLSERLRRRRGSFPPEEYESSDQRIITLNQVVFAVTALAVMVASGLFSGRLVTGMPEPAGAINYMKSRGLSGNILCDFNWGGYVIFHMAPQSLVFTDSRYDLVYPDRITAEYLEFLRDEPGANRVLDRWPHDFVLISPRSHAWRLMTSRKDWKLIYRDQNCGLFARVDSEASKDPDLPATGEARETYFP
jgi:hypothetical protein